MYCSFTSRIFKFYITVCIYLFNLYVCILYFNLFWNCICNFVIIVVTYFNLKFCSKFVLFYINYSWLSILGLALLLHEAILLIFFNISISIGWTPYKDFFKMLLKLKLKFYLYMYIYILCKEYMKFTQSSGFVCLLMIKTMNIFYFILFFFFG